MTEILQPIAEKIFESAAKKLIDFLLDLKSTKEHNVTIVDEVNQFVTSLNENIQIVKDKLPKKSTPWALESLKADLDKASAYLEECLKKGYFRALWDAKQITSELVKLRQDLVHNFQVKLFITTLEVVVDGDKKMENFQSRMLQLSALSTAHSDAATSETKSEIRKLLQPLVIGMRRQDEKLKSFISTVRGAEFGLTETSSETQKFLADVLANLEDLTEVPPPITLLLEDEDEQYRDPISCELMCDPVKCKDGRTYDRWTVLKYNLTQSIPLVIVCEDVDVRGRIFQKFPDEGLEGKYHSLRKEYREQALKLADEGQYGEALAMLNNVLVWANDDAKCLEVQKKMKEEIDRLTSPPILDDMEPIKKPAYTTPVPKQRPAQPAPQAGDDDLCCKVCFLICCFPWSMCCFPCLFPNTYGGNKY